MGFFFPGVLTIKDIFLARKPHLRFHVDSGTNALRLAIRSLKLSPGDSIALPSFVCSSVESAVLQEGLVPYKLDLQNDISYWTNYDFAKIIKKKIKAIIIVHLFGFMHPETTKIVSLAEKNGVAVVHDVAQSYGIGIPGNGIKIYSFGPGKSTVAAQGGFLEGIDEDFYNKNVARLPAYSFISILLTQKAKGFVRWRTYGYHFSKLDKAMDKFIIMGLSVLHKGRKIFPMTNFQLKAAGYMLDNFEIVKKSRIQRYLMLKKAVLENPHITIPYDDGLGQYFKIIIYCRENPDEFADYLQEHHVQYFRLFNSKSKGSLKDGELFNFCISSNKFFELSTEASVPLDKIAVIQEYLKKWKMKL